MWYFKHVKTGGIFGMVTCSLKRMTFRLMPFRLMPFRLITVQFTLIFSLAVARWHGTRQHVIRARPLKLYSRYRSYSAHRHRARRSKRKRASTRPLLTAPTSALWVSRLSARLAPALALSWTRSLEESTGRWFESRRGQNLFFTLYSI